MAEARQRRKRAAEAPARRQRPRLAALVGEGTTADFDRLVAERVRLGILAALAVNRRMSFAELKDLLQTSDGNLSVHARKLEGAGYLACHKSFTGRQPKTEYELTARGRQALQRYLDHMDALIRATRRG